MSGHDEELVGWKQIGAFLGVSEPTARRYWREDGLPVIDRSRRYFAYTGELAAWKREHGRRVSPAETRNAKGNGEGERIVRPSSRAPALVVLGAVLSLALFLAVSRWQEWKEGAKTVSWVSLEGERLVAYDATGSKLWRRIPIPDQRPLARGQTEPVVADLDGDGRSEVLFDATSMHPERNQGRLVCLDDTGQIRWEYAYQGDLWVGERYFEPVWVGHHVRVVESRQGTWVLLVIRHATYYPARVFLLDPLSGQVVGEYWHPGYIHGIAVADIHADGTDELLLGGQNNPGDGSGYASLAVLPLPFAAKAGDRSEVFDFENAREAAYLLFPRPDVHALSRHLSMVWAISVQSASRLQLAAGREDGILHYYLDEHLDVIDLRASDTFVTVHDEAFAAGDLDHRFEQSELTSWRRALRLPTAPDGNGREVQAAFEALAAAASSVPGSR